jgi:TrmH family RNA methyltransferase
MAVSKNQIKFISSLHLKKNREEEGLFIVEGEKIAVEILSQKRYNIKTIFALQDWIVENNANLNPQKYEIFSCNESDLERISALKTPNRVLFVLETVLPVLQSPKGKKNLILDSIQDPGNLGTIIRIADWFGIENIYCSKETVELYNSKVLQATMGSFLRVNLSYLNLSEFLTSYPEIPCYAALLNGENVFSTKFPDEAFLLIGNEGKGISDNLLQLPHIPISIPRFGHAESLNAAVATGILCALLKK